MKMYEKLKKYMEDKGIKQNYISEKTLIPENTLSMIFNGKRKLSADEFEAIVLALNANPSVFINNNFSNFNASEN